VALHELRGSGAPSSTPTQLNQHYLDTVSGNIYFSKGTSSSADWVLMATSGSGVTSFNFRTGVVVPVSGDYTKSDVGLSNVDNTSDATKNAAVATLTNKTISAASNTITGLTKSDVGLSNVDNTSDATKNSAVATLTNKILTAPVINSPTGIVKADVGLSNVDNTSDLNKPVSTATQTALNLKANLASPALTGVPTAPTASNGTNTTQIATTAFVLANSGTPADATTTSKGIVQLAGDLAGTATSPTVPGLAGKEPAITAGTTAQYWRGDKSWQTLNSTAVGLGSVNNTADTAKNIAGDVTGTLGASTVAKLQNRTMASTLPSNGQALVWNSTSSQWEPQTVGGGSGISVVTTSNAMLTLTSVDNNYQVFVGNTAGQKITMPNATTLTAGSDYFLVNKSSVLIPVFTNGGALLGVIYPEQYLECMVTDISTSAGIWFQEAAVPASPTQSVLFDDFTGAGTTSGAIGKLGWTLVAGGGHTVGYVAGTSTDYGILNLGTGTGILAGYAIHMGNTASVVGGGIRVNEWRVRFPTLATAVSDYSTYIGLLNTITATAEPTNGVYFTYSRATSTNWIIKTANGGTRTSTTTSVAVNANQWYKITLVINADGTQVDYYIDGTFVGSITTNISTAALGPSWNSQKTVAASDVAQHIDYMYDYKNFSTVR
jgi:hypothetical protein